MSPMMKLAFWTKEDGIKRGVLVSSDDEDHQSDVSQGVSEISSLFARPMKLLAEAIIDLNDGTPSSNGEWQELEDALVVAAQALVDFWLEWDVEMTNKLRAKGVL